MLQASNGKKLKSNYIEPRISFVRFRDYNIAGTEIDLKVLC